MSKLSIIIRLFLTGVLCILMTQADALPPKNTIEYFIKEYGEVQPEQHMKVRHTHEIFAKVRSVADKNSKRLPKLVIVNSPNNPWAIALPSGHIVLSMAAVEICFSKAKPQEVDARLAFVLGHELAHLAHDDFLHNKFFGFVSNNPQQRSINQLLLKTNASTRELTADNKGFIYAAISGFRVDMLLNGQQRASDFFSFWAKQTHQQNLSSTFDKKKTRAAEIKKQLSGIFEKISLFDYGVRLSHFGSCDDAIYFFKAFLSVYPGREVFNNLGYCYLQQAIAEMAPERAYFYWLPSILDGKTRVNSLALRSGVKNLQSIADGKAQGFLNEAKDFFVEATKADPSYLPAKINLATTYLYLGKPHQARAVLEEGLQQAPQNRDALLLKALAIYEQNDVGMDMWLVATKQLENIAVGLQPDPKAVFNLARLLSIRPRAAKSREFWNKLAESPEYLPALIKSIVCFNQSIVSPKICRKEQLNTKVKKQWTWPLPIQTTGLLSEKTKQVLKGWQLQRINLNQESLKGYLHVSPDNAEVLELDGFIQMKIVKHQNLGKVSDLQEYCKKQLQHRTLSQGEIWTCGHWAALTRENNVDEVWWMAK